MFNPSCAPFLRRTSFLPFSLLFKCFTQSRTLYRRLTPPVVTLRLSSSFTPSPVSHPLPSIFLPILQTQGKVFPRGIFKLVCSSFLVFGGSFHHREVRAVLRVLTFTAIAAASEDAAVHAAPPGRDGGA
jgi:hypothetical protein